MCKAGGVWTIRMSAHVTNFVSGRQTLLVPRAEISGYPFLPSSNLKAVDKAHILYHYFHMVQALITTFIESWKARGDDAGTISGQKATRTWEENEGKEFGEFKDAGNQVLWHHAPTAICFPLLVVPPILFLVARSQQLPIVLHNLEPISVNFILNVPQLSFAYI